MSLPADIQAALAKLEPEIRAAFLAAVEQVQSVSQKQAIITHLENGDLLSALQVLRLDRTFFAPFDRAIEQAFWQGGVLALAGLPRIPDPFPGADLPSALTDDTPALKNGSGSGPER